MLTAAELLWPRVDRSGDCWLWTGPVDSRGYGHIRVGGRKGRNARAHRLAYELTVGPIPAKEPDDQFGLVVMHRCDNRLCCRPEHLSLGTQAENIADMRQKGRRKGIGAGVDNGRAKLTIEQVRAIRADGRGKRTIAKDYGVCPAQVQRIRLGKQWVSA